MTYSKQTWADGTGGHTPLSADRLNHIEDGIAGEEARALAAEDGLNTAVNNETSRATTDATTKANAAQAASVQRVNHSGTQTASTISDFDNAVHTSRLDQLAAPTSDVSLNAHKITNLATPTASTDAATKAYVDAVAVGLQPKAAVAVASLTNLTLSGEQTIDTVLTSASRILVKDQTTTSQNGIYVTAAGAWTRASDANTGPLLVSASVVVSGGSQAGTGWVQVTPSPITIGSSAIVWSLNSAAANITAGTGLNKTGNTLSVLYGATSTTATVGNDSRVTGAEQTTNKGAASGYMGLDINSRGAQAPKLHAATHASGGTDDISATYVLKAGATMTGALLVPDQAYNASSWDNSMEVPTKNAVRDKIESLSIGGVNNGQITTFSLGDGVLTTGIFQQRFRTQIGNIQILGVSASTGFGFGPTGASIVLDLVTSSTGDTMWNVTPANRPTILVGNQETVAETVPDVITVAANTSIRAKCVSVGTTLPGSYVVLYMRWQWV